VQTITSRHDPDPVGEVLDQHDVLNACLRVETDLDPEELLDACKAVEHELGRRPDTIRHGPRPVDVDVLLLADLVHSSRRLQLPHPQATRRPLVLLPPLALDPELTPPDRTRLAHALPALGAGPAA